MSFLKRITNILTAKGNKALDSLENPIEQLDLDIKKKQNLINEIKQSSAEFVGLLRQIPNEINILRVETSKYDIAIRKAKESGDVDNALNLLKEKKEKEVFIQIKQDQYETQQKSAEKLKQSIGKLENEISTLKIKRAEYNARYITAQNTKKMNLLINNLDLDSSISTNDVEEKIKKVEAYNEGITELCVEKESHLEKYLKVSDHDELLKELDTY